MEVLHIAFVVLRPNHVALSVLAIVKGFREFCAVSVKTPCCTTQGTGPFWFFPWTVRVWSSQDLPTEVLKTCLVQHPVGNRLLFNKNLKMKCITSWCCEDVCHCWRLLLGTFGVLHFSAILATSMAWKEIIYWQWCSNTYRSHRRFPCQIYS